MQIRVAIKLLTSNGIYVNYVRIKLKIFSTIIRLLYTYIFVYMVYGMI